MDLFIKGLSTWVKSRLDPCPKEQEQNRTSPAKIAEPIEVPLGLWTQVSPRNHVVDRGSDPPMGRGNFEGGRGGPL